MTKSPYRNTLWPLAVVSLVLWGMIGAWVRALL